MKERGRNAALIIIAVGLIVIPLLLAIVNNSLHLPPQLDDKAWLLFGAGLIILFLLVVAQFRLQPKLPSQLPSAEEMERNYSAIRRKMENQIHDVKSQSFQAEDVPLKLNFLHKPTAVVQPANPFLEQTTQAPSPLPPGTSIYEVYNSARGQLLILGEPGAGKTIQLFLLAEELLFRSRGNNHQPIPVLFHLSRWTVGLPLSEWLIKELFNEPYHISLEQAKWWIEHNQIIPLLDGLDTLAWEQSAACIAAINDYQPTIGERSIVVCCQNTHYFNLPNRLVLQQAISVQPLNSAQIQHYLDHEPQTLETVKQAIGKDPILKKLVETPLMLNVVTRTYRGAPVSAFPTGNIEQRRQEVWKAYVQRMFKRPGDDPHYQQQQTKLWLHWLAQRLFEHERIFYLEQLQPGWLNKGWIRWLYRFIVMEMICIIFFTSVGGFILQLTGLVAGILTGLVLGLLTACLKWPKAMQTTLLRRGCWFFTRILLFGLGGGLVFMAFDMPTRVMLKATSINLGLIGSADLSALVISDGIVIGVIAGIFGGFVDRLVNERENLSIQPVEIVVWSWKEAIKTFFKFVACGFCAGIVVGLIISLALQSPSVLPGMLRLGLFLGAVFGLVFSFFKGWVEKQRNVEDRVKPNQGILDSRRNMLFVGGISGGVTFLVYAPLFTWVLWSNYGSEYALLGLILGLLFAVIVGILCSLFKGGVAYIKHLTLRLLLICNGWIPQNYTRFLDYAANRNFLVKRGGGYEFFHESLQKYFARMTQLKRPKKASSSERGHYKRNTGTHG